MKLDWVRNEITRKGGQMRAQELEIQMLQRAGVATASAKALPPRTQAQVDDLSRERSARTNRLATARRGRPSPCPLPIYS